VKRGTGIGKFIARMNLFALGRLIIAKRNRVVTEEEDREWKMIFKARNWNKLRSSTDNSQSLNPISVSGVRDSLLWSSYILVARLCEPISFCSRTVLGIVKKQLNDVGRRIVRLLCFLFLVLSQFNQTQTRYW